MYTHTVELVPIKSPLIRHMVDFTITRFLINTYTAKQRLRVVGASSRGFSSLAFPFRFIQRFLLDLLSREFLPIWLIIGYNNIISQHNIYWYSGNRKGRKNERFDGNDNIMKKRVKAYDRNLLRPTVTSPGGKQRPVQYIIITCILRIYRLKLRFEGSVDPNSPLFCRLNFKLIYQWYQ